MFKTAILGKEQFLADPFEWGLKPQRMGNFSNELLGYHAAIAWLLVKVLSKFDPFPFIPTGNLQGYFYRYTVIYIYTHIYQPSNEMHMTVSSICGFHGMTNGCGYMAMSRYISNNIASHNLIYPQYILYPNFFLLSCISATSHYIPIASSSSLYTIPTIFQVSKYIPKLSAYVLNCIPWHIFNIYIFSIISDDIYSTYLLNYIYIYIYPMTFIPHLFSIISHDTYSTYCLNYIPWHIFDILSQLYPMMCIPHSTYLLNYIPWHTHIITYIYI